MTDLEILQTHREIYISGFNNLKGIIEILTKDFHNALKMQQGEQIQDSAGRTAFRTLFSLIEAIIYSLKRIALDLAKQGVGDFTVAEITMLEEQLCKRPQYTAVQNEAQADSELLSFRYRPK